MTTQDTPLETLEESPQQDDAGDPEAEAKSEVEPVAEAPVSAAPDEAPAAEASDPGEVTETATDESAEGEGKVDAAPVEAVGIVDAMEAPLEAVGEVDAIEAPVETVGEVSSPEATVAEGEGVTSETQGSIEAADQKKEPAKAPKPAAKGPEPPPERPEVLALRQAKDDQQEVEGRVIGWNRGGFHVVIGGITAFCPRSEMELGHPRSPKEYLDKTFNFQVLKVQKRGRRVVLSRTSAIKSERSKVRAEVRDKIEPGGTLLGRVASLTDFGAFVDIGGGVQGLVHISEISHQRVEKPADVLHVDQEISVKILNVEKGGKRISLSIRALESNPWSDIKQKYPEGTVLTGKVQKTTKHGAFVELEPGLTGLLPMSAMSLPRDASVARAFPPGRELTLQIVTVDDRRHRISLAPEGSALEGTRRDFQTYSKDQDDEDRHGFHALANAFKKAHIDAD